MPQEHNKNKEPVNDAWGNQFDKNYTRKRIESARVKRMRELNDDNSKLTLRCGDLMERIHCLEDVVSDQQELMVQLKEDLTVAEGKAIERSRASKAKTASKTAPKIVPKIAPKTPKKTVKKPVKTINKTQTPN